MLRVFVVDGVAAGSESAATWLSTLERRRRVCSRNIHLYGTQDGQKVHDTGQWYMLKVFFLQNLLTLYKICHNVCIV